MFRNQQKGGVAASHSVAAIEPGLVALDCRGIDVTAMDMVQPTNWESDASGVKSTG